ncbi:hypothetical protein BU56_33025 [Escherichia coli O145:H25 str. 07-3858]|nr:hypothetical protein BU56_33025 [Escherichia coli O145:H25 str. 07-3858]
MKYTSNKLMNCPHFQIQTKLEGILVNKIAFQEVFFQNSDKIPIIPEALSTLQISGPDLISKKECCNFSGVRGVLGEEFS